MLSASFYMSIPNTIDLISPNLYLTSLEHVNDVENLRRLKISHILTIEDRPIKENIQEQFVYKFKMLSDYMFNDVIDILEECIEFIDSAIQNDKNIVVHCLAGISRSASIVIAYLMAKNKLSFKEAYTLVKQQRPVKPNPGFIHQLQLFEIMNFKVDKDSLVYKTYKLDNLTYPIKFGGRLNINLKECYSPSEINHLDVDITVYECKNCRFKLFNNKNIIHHLKGQDFRRFYKRADRIDMYKELNKIQYESKEDKCKNEFYIEPLKWFMDKLEPLNSEINCPECSQTIGYYNWSGVGCNCGAWLRPGFYINPNFIEISLSEL